MPNVASFNLRTGWRSHYLIAEAVATNMTTLGGFDIRRNDMPFPSNKMNATTVGANLKYTPRAMSGLSIIGGGNYTVAGRNMGQSTTIYGGLFYVLDFNKNMQPILQLRKNKTMRKTLYTLLIVLTGSLIIYTSCKKRWKVVPTMYRR